MLPEEQEIHEEDPEEVAEDVVEVELKQWPILFSNIP